MAARPRGNGLEPPTDAAAGGPRPGVATLHAGNKTEPEKQTQKIENILDKLGARWEKILAGMGE